jgi:hypothetical protein
LDNTKELTTVEKKRAVGKQPTKARNGKARQNSTELDLAGGSGVKRPAAPLDEAATPVKKKDKKKVTTMDAWLQRCSLSLLVFGAPRALLQQLLRGRLSAT